MATQMNRKLILENGAVFPGTGFGAAMDRMGLLVFNTSMVGYQEIVSDAANHDLMVVMTYPLIGSYGVNDEDDECKNPNMAALVVRDYNDVPSNFRYTKTLAEAMEEDGIPGITGLDTRELTRMIRDEGVMRAMLTDANTPVETALETLRAWQPDAEAVSKVSCRKRWYSRTPNHVYNVVALDCGIQLSCVKDLNALGCNVTVVPYSTTPEQILALQPDGVFVSSGPNSPESVPGVAQTIRALVGKLPIFGMGLGHQIIAMSFGARVLQLKAGHHGSNHPIRCLATGKIEMDRQNHLYALDPASLEDTGLEVTHVNVLDGSIEAVRSTEYPVFSAQFIPGVDHPMFTKFLNAMDEGRKNNA